MQIGVEGSGHNEQHGRALQQKKTASTCGFVIYRTVADKVDMLAPTSQLETVEQVMQPSGERRRRMWLPTSKRWISCGHRQLRYHRYSNPELVNQLPRHGASGRVLDREHQDAVRSCCPLALTHRHQPA